MRENNSHTEAVFQSRVGASCILCLRGSVLFSVSSFCRDSCEGAPGGGETKLPGIFCFQGLGERWGEEENSPGLGAGLKALHNSCLVVTVPVTFRSAVSPACAKLV